MIWTDWVFALFSVGTFSAWFCVAALTLFAQVADYQAQERDKQTLLHALWEKMVREIEPKR